MTETVFFPGVKPSPSETMNPVEHCKLSSITNELLKKKILSFHHIILLRFKLFWRLFVNTNELKSKQQQHRMIDKV